MSTTSHERLTVGTDTRHILGFALPISLSILVPQLNFVTNNIFLGHLSERALAVAGITGVFYLIFAVIGNGLNNGLQALIARRAGEKRVGEIGILFGQGVRVGFFLAAFGIAVTYLAAPAILRSSLHSAEDADMAIRFLRIRIWGLPLLYIYQLRNALLVGVNQSKYLIYGTLAETVTNIFFDYCLIFGHLGFPALGFDGAAYASIIAEFAGLIFVFGAIHFKGLGRELNLFNQFAYHPAQMKLILVQSSPLIFQYAISIGTWEFFYILIEHHGARDLAISNAMRNLFGIAGCAVWAFASTASAMVSNLIGQGKKNEVIPLINRIVRLSLACTIGVGIFLNFFPGLYLGIFGQNRDFVDHAIPVVRVLTVAMMMMSFGTTWLNAVAGTGATRWNLAIEAVTLVFYTIYVWLALEVYNLPLIYAWMSEWLYWTLVFIQSRLFMRSRRWENKVI